MGKLENLTQGILEQELKEHASLSEYGKLAKLYIKEINKLYEEIGKLPLLPYERPYAIAVVERKIEGLKEDIGKRLEALTEEERKVILEKLGMLRVPGPPVEIY